MVGLRVIHGELSMTPGEFEQWLLTSRPGDKVVYHDGFLTRDNPDVGRVALNAAGYGTRRINQGSVEVIQKGTRLVNLVQRRVGEDRFEYEAQRI